MELSIAKYLPMVSFSYFQIEEMIEYNALCFFTPKMIINYLIQFYFHSEENRLHIIKFPS